MFDYPASFVMTVWSLVTMSERFGGKTGQGVIDTDWLQLAGEDGWPVSAKNERIRYQAAERAAIRACGVREIDLAD